MKLDPEGNETSEVLRTKKRDIEIGEFLEYF